VYFVGSIRTGQQTNKEPNSIAPSRLNGGDGDGAMRRAAASIASMSFTLHAIQLPYRLGA